MPPSARLPGRLSPSAPRYFFSRCCCAPCAPHQGGSRTGQDSQSKAHTAAYLVSPSPAHRNPYAHAIDIPPKVLGCHRLPMDPGFGLRCFVHPLYMPVLYVKACFGARADGFSLWRPVNGAGRWRACSHSRLSTLGAYFD